MPRKFVDVQVGSEVSHNFRLYLEKRFMAEHLDVYTMIEKVEGGLDWSPEEAPHSLSQFKSRY